MIDYKKLGLKAGLEIHQQLDTTKLFCSCPSKLRDDKPDVIVKRQLRPVASELGKIDVAAAFEKVSLNLSNDPKSRLIPSSNSPEGIPPPLGPIFDQKRL